jgi:tyrosyl-tRNA synthetase
MTLLHFQKCGIKPIIVLGGATGLIGDPSGRSATRAQLTPEKVNENIDAFKHTFSSLLHNIYSEEHAKTYFSNLSKTTDDLIKDIKFINNIDFYQNMSVIEFIRDIGSNFRMGSLLSRDSVASRLNSPGKNHNF